MCILLRRHSKRTQQNSLTRSPTYPQASRAPVLDAVFLSRPNVPPLPPGCPSGLIKRLGVKDKVAALLALPSSPCAHGTCQQLLLLSRRGKGDCRELQTGGEAQRSLVTVERASGDRKLPILVEWAPQDAKSQEDLSLSSWVGREELGGIRKPLPQTCSGGHHKQDTVASDQWWFE